MRDLLEHKDASLGDLEGRLDQCEQDYADLQATLTHSQAHFQQTLESVQYLASEQLQTLRDELVCLR